MRCVSGAMNDPPERQDAGGILGSMVFPSFPLASPPRMPAPPGCNTRLRVFCVPSVAGHFRPHRTPSTAASHDAPSPQCGRPRQVCPCEALARRFPPAACCAWVCAVSACPRLRAALRRPNSGDGECSLCSLCSPLSPRHTVLCSARSPRSRVCSCVRMCAPCCGRDALREGHCRWLPSKEFRAHTL
jgi:hypothetical protein